ncbi:phosphoribosylaminoimidazolesuccinocarboxamide synthase [Candidatus Nomurabacteria bacterium RIFCSPHIGHO2_01_FULL_37_25]|uniref:Phosphoribosylaminoimidazole-succinocarboxamide synthase n=1 Tax=Candidatus Nomurabacteria bacterium RIFCSPLOWO2_01_FULL_36_16 TaxID=1801767 RepID=A0A1F6WY67_9BACT|nr:MAG: phosphoribosylaminoimidazolesuccinocarboxamide synthase [Candidatus Nomurabacteria bacterium RIFCSPHIGHO2_01_FULL_37_25]OGI75176.1 MAG: phosphoribosylaminoimidazolesuccinocarboxamide synthase [Candidatus Nomurabacteria bacterium RIFCSPHIGHO2_02_FULL_36_29]OGI86831.1 MAG: phosphoribosylaminoimidazolesuccinocarboxamide synthase [Candidatus Nomurabacteria bacterium RIFCSPLOWO2_01_FULL_36_16]OGI94661.1 MAG: phosphoribosylaminoimidazolesuccinocarboxamide synthase [Candidatus Nomurabacteria ba
MNILEKTNFKNLGEKYTGKVRDVYIQKDKIIMVSTDRYSAFDRNLALIPYKGQVLTQTSKFWFEQTRDIVSNHVIDFPDPNVVVGKKCAVLPVEMVVRGYITGVTSTSLWVNYQKGQRDFGDFVLPEGMKKNQKLDKPVITPTTKHEMHDRNLTSKMVIEEKFMEPAIWQKVCQIALKLFERGQEVALKRGLILVDTKYEFGLTPEREIMLIDEIHTPDSSRYWQASSYQKRIDEGLEPENFDKEFLRLWFRDNCDPYKNEKLPEAPFNMVMELSSRYVRICEQITGEPFKIEIGDIEKRIENNLKKYNLNE